MNDTTATNRLRSERSYFRFFWLCWVAGLAINSLLFVQQWQLTSDTSASVFGCSAIGADCSAVLMSPLGKLNGLPLTVWAFGYYLGLAVTIIVARRAAPLVSATVVPLVSSTGAVAAVWFVMVMAFQIREYCPWCLALHAVNVANFYFSVVRCHELIAGEAKRFSAGGLQGFGRRQIVGTYLAGSVLAGCEIALFLFLTDNGQLKVMPIPGISNAIALAGFESQNPAASSDPDQLITTFKGDPSSPRRLVLFTCFTCPACRQVNSMLSSAIDRDPQSFRVDIRIAPLSAACNPVWAAVKEKATHIEACQIGRAALAVAVVAPEEFSAYSDWLYANQQGLSLKIALDEAKRRVSPAEFDIAFESRAVQNRLESDIAIAQTLGVKGVPKIVMQQGRVDGQITVKNLGKLIRRSFLK